MHPLHVEHRPEEADLVVHTTESLHALEQLQGGVCVEGEESEVSGNTHTTDPQTHRRTDLNGVVQGGAGRVQRQVLEGFDLRWLPAACLGPLDGQHVVREVLAEHQ